ncbi:energy transducer TonB [Xanthocytophaga agilis]|uniref:Energy transducer TonB n=1 Tax=Xanthocytophaga agilis TaxID=3048010 RepID=A0AAE3R9E6_9BACT|nr:energy transducer TonB [Xanthocytophaga agilis]MDJ1503138.1 energy transducer TonB [Xanthocytophaga agilis]
MKRPLIQLSTYCIFCILSIALFLCCNNESSSITTQKKLPDTLLVEEKIEDLLISDSDYLERLNFYKLQEEDIITGAVVDKVAEFPGGEKAMKSFIQKHLKYPHTSSDISGVVYVTFWVQQDGHLEDIHVLKGIGSDFDKEALRVIQLMPNWKPAQLNHRNVPLRYTLPISFSPHIK